MTVSVVVADDHPMFRAGMVTVLQDLDDIAVVGQAANGLEAIELVGSLSPHVVLMDLRMPELGGLEATARIKVEHPDTAVIVLTMDSDDDSIFAALRAGARGYLLKEADGQDIERAITGVARGEAVFGAGIAERVLALFSQGRSSAVSPFPELTPRELEMLELIAAGRRRGRGVRHRVGGVHQRAAAQCGESCRGLAGTGRA